MNPERPLHQKLLRLLRAMRLRSRHKPSSGVSELIYHHSISRIAQLLEQNKGIFVWSLVQSRTSATSPAK